MSGSKGKEVKSDVPTSKDASSNNDSRLDDSRIVNIDPDEERDLEVSLDMDQIRSHDDEEEKVDSDKEDIEHKGGPRTPGRRNMKQDPSQSERNATAEEKPTASQPTAKPDASKPSTQQPVSSGNVSKTSETAKDETKGGDKAAKGKEPPSTTKDSSATSATKTSEKASEAEKPSTSKVEKAEKAEKPPVAEKEKAESSSWKPWQRKPKAVATPAASTASTASAAAPTSTPATTNTEAKETDKPSVDAPKTTTTAAKEAPGAQVPAGKDKTVAQPDAVVSAESTKPVITKAADSSQTAAGKTEAAPVKTISPEKEKKREKEMGTEKEKEKEKPSTGGATPAAGTTVPSTSAPSAVPDATTTPAVVPTTATTPAQSKPPVSKEQSSAGDSSTTATTTTAASASASVPAGSGPASAEKAPLKTEPPKATPTKTTEPAKDNAPSSTSKTTKNPSRETEEDHKTQPSQPAGRTFKFKRNREVAEVTGNQGGQAVSVLPPHALSLKMQAAWRGKLARRKLRVQQIAAVAIQAIYRGNKEREKSGAQLRSHREKIAAEQTRKTRLAHIRSKEKDLALLATIPPDQYLDFERLRRENGAKAIQRNFRAMQQYRSDARQAAAEANLDDWLADDVLLGNRAHTATSDTRRYPRAFTGKTGKPSLTGHASTAGSGKGRGGRGGEIPGASSSLLGSAPASAERVLREQSDKLRAHMVKTISDGLAERKKEELFAHFKAQTQTPGTKTTHTAATPSSSSSSASTPLSNHHWKKYEVEVEALALAQLQRKIREAAHTRTRQADARSTRSGFRPNAGAYKGSSADVNLSYDANSGESGAAGVGGAQGSGGVPRWGARRNYQDLVEAQTHAGILLQEHQFVMPHLQERQRIRHQALGNCQHLLEQLQKPLSLDQARAFLSEQKKASKGGEIGSKGGPSDPHAAAWLLDEDLWAADKGPRVGADVSGGGSGSGTSGLYVHAPAVQAAAEQHVHALYALRTSSIPSANPTSTTTNTTPASSSAHITRKHWGAVALPLPLQVVTAPAPVTDAERTPSASLRGSGDWKDLRNSFNRSFDANADTTSGVPKSSAGSAEAVGSLSQRLLTDAKLFRPLASQWAKGSDVEDSLYWIAYATQPSNITPHPIDPSPMLTGGEEGGTDKSSSATAQPLTVTAPAPQYEELRRRIAVEAMGLSQRVPRVQRQVKHEEERVGRLAEVYQAEMFAYLRREHALSAQQLLGGEKAQLQHTAARRIQAVARGRSSRARTTAMRAQQRVYLALQNLFHEIALSEGLPPPPLPAPYYGHHHQQQQQNGSTQHGGRGGAQAAQTQARGNIFNSLLSSLAPHAQPHSAHGAHGQQNLPLSQVRGVGVGSGHSAASMSRNSSSTLAGLNITSSSHPHSSQQHFGNTQLSALTATPQGYSSHGHGHGSHTAPSELRTVSTATPQSRAGYEPPQPSLGAQYPLQSVLPPTNRQFTAQGAQNMHTDPRALVSNVTHKHVNVHGQTPSYFSPMVAGPGHGSPSRGIDAHYKDYTSQESKNEYKYGEQKSGGGGGMGIAGTPGSVVNRGAWSSGAPAGSNKYPGGNSGSGVDSRTGASILGISSPSRQTFNLLTASFTAGDQVPEESLQLSQSFTSTAHSVVGTPHPHSPPRGALSSAGGGARRHAPHSGSGAGTTMHTGPFSPKASVSFSLEVPADHSIPSGRQLQRSTETPLASSPLRHAPHSNTPGSAASHLSEFSYMHDEDVNPGAAYISSPGHSHHSHSLSRSLSASFGQVSGNLSGDDLDFTAEKERDKDMRRAAGKHTPQRQFDSKSSSHSPERPHSQGGLSPALLAKYGAPQRQDSDDSVEGLEIPYTGSRNDPSASLKGFRVHGSVQAGRIAASAAVAVGQAMGVVEARYRSNSCTVQSFTASAMAADPRNFDKAAALRLLQSMAMVTGVSPLIDWLQRFRYDPQQAQLNDPDYVPHPAGGPSPNSSLVLSVGEIAVPDCALLIAELTAELHLLDTSSQQRQKSAAEGEKEMMYNLIQTCVLLKLLGAASDTGRLRLSELGALLEDAWVLAVPVNGVRVSLMLAQLRFSLLQHATRKACHPRKAFDDLLTHSKVPLLPPAKPITKPLSKPPSKLDEEDEEPCLSVASAGRLFEVVFSTSAQFSVHSTDKGLCAELAQAVVRFVGWRDDAESVAVHALRSFLCSLCSFRSLQKRIQVWFRAVPGMHQTLLQEAAVLLNADPRSAGMVSSAVFCRACDASGLPLSHAECFMLGQLLTRRRVPTGAAATSAEGGPASAFVDVAQLQRIKTGDFLQAAL